MFNNDTLVAAGIGLATMCGIVVHAGCGGDDSSPGGSADDDGTGAKQAEDPNDGSAGSPDGTAGTAGGGGTAGWTCARTPPPNANITDFAVWRGGEWGDDQSLTGGSFDYKDGKGTIRGYVEDEVLHLMGKVDTYVGYGLWFGPCTDVSDYAGIGFTVGGESCGASLQFQVQTANNYPYDPVGDGADVKGSCDDWSEGRKWSDCSNAHNSSEKIPEEPEFVAVVWAELTGGFPVDEVEPAELLGIQFQLENAESADCEFNVVIDDVHFLTEDEVPADKQNLKPEPDDNGKGGAAGAGPPKAGAGGAEATAGGAGGA